MYLVCSLDPTKLLLRILSLILQGLRVAQAAVTERWQQKEEKTPERQLFFVKLIRLHANGYPSATLNVPSDPLGLHRPP